jgi:hypothetical protein
MNGTTYINQSAIMLAPDGNAVGAGLRATQRITGTGTTEASQATAF